MENVSRLGGAQTRAGCGRSLRMCIEAFGADKAAFNPQLCSFA